jgi:16S rRNA A1518/A1519 N6-dimethyltransferase RsmA/KsgA/DIM1 with predicted DNA glycosylase/AP lyase activity
MGLLIMFEPENQFFPTPTPVIDRMLRGLNWDGRRKLSVLEPSAGNGAILDRLKSAYGYHRDRLELHAIEIDQELRFLLQGKGYRVIGADFLEYSEPAQFDLVIANPPFNSGAAHLLKGWEMVSPEGQLIALVNSETLNNPCSHDRRRLNTLIEAHGEAVDLGQAFREADRPASVNISMVVLKKPKQERMPNDFSAAKFETKEVSAEEFAANPLAHTDVLDTLVICYQQVEARLIQRHEAQQKMNFYLSGIADPYYGTFSPEQESLTKRVALAEQVHELKSRFWNTVFSRTRLGQRATSDFQADFHKFARNQSHMAFTKANVVEVLTMFFANNEQIMMDCLLKMFDRATEYHKANQIHHEGWVTNKGWKLNYRIIHPNCIGYESRWGGRFTEKAGYGVRAFLEDMDRVLAWVGGTSTEDAGFIGSWDALDKGLSAASNQSYQGWLFSTFFAMRIHKKGTLWMDFQDKKLLADFNKKAAQGKKWIGGEGF